MTITTTYKCDRCGHEQTTREQMWQIELSIHHLESTPHKREFHWIPATTPLWCRNCCDQLGLIGPWKPPAPPPAPQEPPSLEDKIREIVRDELAG